MAERTKELLKRLRRHYIKPDRLPGGIFVPECGINGGTGAGSRADALYVGFTSTSGRLLVGHELKVTRADWRRELDKAGKADFWADNCHQWIIVAPGPEVVPAEEVPHGWGLMYPSPRTTTRMKVIIKPTTHSDRVPSWRAVRSIMARTDTLRAQEQAAFERAALDKARKQAEEQVRARFRHEDRGAMSPEQRRRLDTLDRLEKLLGAPIAQFAFDADEGIDANVAAAALRIASTIDGMHLDRGHFAAASIRDQLKRVEEGLAAYDQARSTLLDLAVGTNGP